MRSAIRLATAWIVGSAVIAGAGMAGWADLRAEASLVSDHAAIAPGTVFTIALRLQMPEDAYVYWRNPGDAGLPTQVEWKLPEGFEAEALQWPVPGVFDEPPLRSFGYKGEALLFARVRAPNTLPDSGDLVFGASAEWLICREACVPGDAQPELTLAIAPEARPDAAGRALIQRFRAKLPEGAEGWSGRVTVDKSSLAIRISLPEGEQIGTEDEILLLPYTEGLVEPSARQVHRRTAEGIELEVDRDVQRNDPGPKMDGLLLIRRNGRLQRAVKVSLASG